MVRSTDKRGEDIKTAIAWFLGLGSSGMVATFLLADDTLTFDTEIVQRALMCLTLAYVAATAALIDFTGDVEGLDEEELPKARNWARFKTAMLAVGLVLLVGAAYYYPKMFMKKSVAQTGMSIELESAMDTVEYANGSL